MTLNFDFAEAAEAFACFAKPSTYIQADLYEPERDEYEQMLGGKAREELVAADFGTVAWGPLCDLTPSAMAYLLPRLMELAASYATDSIGDLFMMRFINRFSDGPTGFEFSLLGATQRSVVTAFLEHLSTEHAELVRQECWEDVLAEAVHNWRDA
jgi:hypothetical protein